MRIRFSSIPLCFLDAELAVARNSIEMPNTFAPLTPILDQMMPSTRDVWAVLLT